MDAFVQKVIAFIKVNFGSFAVAAGIFFLVNFIAPSSRSYAPFASGVVAFFAAKYLIFKK